ncbi:gametogenetin-binding protein 2-like [Callorhinchus milii]|nr:gametogenetin-binding protein 2-like [Callorhinchus milii]
MEGSETGSREGSDVACTEGICNHDETGDDACVHHCVEDKEEDGVDSCVECWANASEENTKGKSKKKKKKNKGAKCDEDSEAPGNCSTDLSRRENLGNTLHNEFHHDKAKDSSNSVKGSQQAAWVTQILSEKHFSQSSQIPPPGLPDWGQGTKTLMELLDESECTSEEEAITPDEIQTFMANNQSFYVNREQYRQLLKEKFKKYCRSNDYKRHFCNGWLTVAGVN